MIILKNARDIIVTELLGSGSVKNASGKWFCENPRFLCPLMAPSSTNIPFRIKIKRASLTVYSYPTHY